MSSISKVFQTLKAKREGALIAYVTAGDPKPELTPKIAEALIRGGADIVELGLPFSDPIADGPTIQAASIRALNAGTIPKMVLQIAKAIKSKHETPVVIMSYYNPILKMGLDIFFSQAKDSKIDGIIVPDLPVEEAGEYRKAAAKAGIDTIFLAAPSTTNERLQNIVSCTSGFLYLVSHYGVTGAKTAVENSTIALVKRVLPFTKDKVPLAVGFGISKPEHVRSLIKAGADAAIVGSTFVNIIANNWQSLDKMTEELENTCRQLKHATVH